MAFVLSSVSGNLISAASAGFAPTNSADVSAIASAYQVVSATATQLYAGSAYLTSVNSAPISATRAGNAANASMANSAYYDGTGRLISALPDEATVSSIASAYAESAARGKQDSGDYISAKGLTQTISNADSSMQVSFGSDNTTAFGSKVAGLFITGSFGTAYYKDNELNLNRNNMKIAFNIGGQGPKISSMATGTRHSYMYLFASGQNSGTYSETGIEFKDSGNNTVALYDSATYGNITSVYDTVSANSATWGQGGVDSATVSAIASSYADSAASSKQDTLSFAYNTAEQISSINGSALAGGGGGGEADWSAESGQPGYIENKPVPKTLVAGAGITITENSTALVVGSTNTLYTAGSGLSLNGTTFSVDTAVVQGKVTYDYDASGNISGIDGSSLVGGDPEAADLYVQSPLYTGVSGGSAYIGWNNETVLYSDFTGRPTNTGDTISLNESPLNFQYVEVYLNGTNATSTAAGWANSYQKIDTVTLSSVPGLTFVGLLSGNSTWWDVGCAYAGVSSTAWTKVLGYTKQVDSTAAGMLANAGHLNIWKVVGLNRTAGE